MPKFSSRSLRKLLTLDHHLVVLMDEVIKDLDIIILYGLRTQQEQFHLFKKGRYFYNGAWIINDKDKVVTSCDGYKKLSKHNPNEELLSNAVDVAPYIVGNGISFDAKQCYYMGGFINCKIKDMNLNHRIRWGGDWDSDMDVNDQNFNDLLHFEII